MGCRFGLLVPHPPGDTLQDRAFIAEIWPKTICIQMPEPPSTSCVTLDKFPPLCEAQCSHLRLGAWRVGRGGLTPSSLAVLRIKLDHVQECLEHCPTHGIIIIIIIIIIISGNSCSNRR